MSPVHPTRQQLDELDALMQRMLALPVDEPVLSPVVGPDHVHREPPPEPSPVRADSGPVLLDDLVPGVDRAPEPGSSPRTEQAAPPASPAPRDEPERLVGLAAAPEESRSPKRPAGELTGGTPGTTGPGRWLLLPLVGINGAFDGVTWLLGPPGRWLRGPGGRTLLGWVGLLLLAAALVWGVLDWFGWIW